MGENNEPQPGWTTVGEVVAVKDGDTVRIRLTREIDVRLLGCWAPEKRLQPSIRSRIVREDAKLRGIAAAEHLRQFALGKRCILAIPTQTADDDITSDVGDVFSLSRALGRVWVDGKDLSELQVERGYATRTKGGGP